MFVTCEELNKSLTVSVRFFKEGNWTPDESNDLLSDTSTYDGADISAAYFENLKMFLESEEDTLQRGGRGHAGAGGGGERRGSGGCAGGGAAGGRGGADGGERNAGDE